MEKALKYPSALEGKAIKLVVGQEAMDLVFDPIFRESWNTLYQSCDWATVFQSPEFVTQWYALYHDYYDPILVYAYSEGQLTGMITLCGGNNGGTITGAGRNDAHYQVWISIDENVEPFILDALEELGKVYKNEDIELIHLPPNAPTGWINPHLNFYCGIKSVSRPFIKLGPAAIGPLVRKKQYRQNRNRLNRLGALRLEKITDSQTFKWVLDELAVQYDFRQGAMYNHTPFKSNLNRKEFYIKLFERGLMYVTVLWLDKEIIASVIGTIGENGCIHGVGINTQSPYYQKLSPGFLNFIMFAERLEADGYRFLDLSTGNQSYKNRLTNTFDTVTGLYISFGGNKKAIRKTRSRLRNLLRRKFFKLNINLEKIKEPYNKKRILLGEKFAIMRRYGILPWIKSKLVWTLNKGSHLRKMGEELYVFSQKKLCTIRRNSISDLLHFEPDGTLLTRWEFLHDSLKRIEAGEIPYTWVMNGKLLACVWVSKDNDIDETTFKDGLVQNEGLLLEGLYLYKMGRRNRIVSSPANTRNIVRRKFQYNTGLPDKIMTLNWPNS